MSFEFVLPVLALLGLAVVLGVGPWELSPKHAVRALTVVAVTAAGTVGLVALATAVGFVVGPARRADLVAWCRIVPLHHDVGVVEGVASLAATIAMALRVGLVLWRLRQATRGTSGRRLSIVDTAQPIAYAAPGRPGCVVVSTGLLSALDPRERKVVFAHERAHLRQGHHRHLALGSVAVAIVPFLKPLVERLRLATERCADEEAVTVLDGDRHLVATAIAKAALAKTAFNGVVPAINGGSVVARINALIGTPPSAWRGRVGLAVMTVGTLSVVAAGSVQVHHLWRLAGHICQG